MLVSIASRIAGDMWALDGAEIANATEAALSMLPVCPAAQHSHLATLIPEMWDEWLTPLRPDALVRNRCNRLWARDGFKRSSGTIATLWVHSVRPATEHPIPALWIPVIWSCWYHVKLAHLGTRAMNVIEATTATESAVHVLAISVAPMLPHDATGIPKILGLRLVGKVACNCFWRRCAFRARDACVREVATEATLLVHPIGPAAQHANPALRVPIIWDKGVLSEFAAAGWAWNLEEVPSATVAALQVYPVGITPEIAELAIWIPVVTNAGR